MSEEQRLKSLSHGEALSRIQAIEQDRDLVLANVDGLDLWPLIRLRLFSLYCFPHHHAAPDGSGQSVARLRKGTGGLLPRVVTRWGRETRKANARAELARVVAPLADAEVLFFSRQKNYQDDYDGRAYDRYVDPLFEFVSKHHRTAKFCFEARSMIGSPPDFHEAVRIPAGLKRRLVDRRDKVRGALGSIVAVLERTSAAHHKYVGSVIDLGVDFADAVVEVLLARDRFRLILETVRPRLICFPCYYAPLQTALVAACNERGIATLDIQHGKQGPLNVNYNHWTAVPEQGFNTVPDFFWVWNQACADNIGFGHGEASRHLPVVGGNLLLSAWRRRPPFDYRRVRTDLWSRIDGARKSILFTLQPLGIERIARSPIWTCLSAMPQDYFWIMKVHPNDPVSDGAWRDYIGAWTGGAGNFVVLRDSAVPLYGLLREVDLHITWFSTTCFEALSFGHRSIVLGEEARDLYAGEIRQGYFRHVSEHEDVAPVVRHSLELGRSADPIDCDASYRVDEQTALSALGELRRAVDARGGGLGRTTKPAQCGRA